MNLKKQRGMTLLEIIIVLGIIGTIAAGVVILAQRAFDSKAISDLVTNTNTVRTTIKETFGPSGVYPATDDNGTLALTESTIKDPTQSAVPIAALVQLGKLSSNEAKNNISSNYFNIGAATIGTATGNRAYFVEVNGLDQKQCRNILLQTGNQWDYVSVVNQGDGAGTYSVTAGTVPNLADTGVVDPSTVTAGGGGVVRSLADTGNYTLTPQNVINLCSDSAENGIVLGSR
ncbi:type IV pilus major pilin [Salmonella enterica subsp. enterica serovar Kinondoni]|nr:type IV pilus major pilin [Salmonella enterica subsp. enterica serovar Kinondoni]MKU04168.1 type IV pilus major pilin [Salmonella enterica subsp. enterica serovar Kinondoni]